MEKNQTIKMYKDENNLNLEKSCYRLHAIFIYYYIQYL